jgi:hypothetical protein
MGKTAFDGPVYGAKSLLWTYGPFADTHSTGASTGLLNANALRVVPNYEDWYITEIQHAASTNSSVANTHGLYVKSEGGSTTGIVRANGGVSTATQTLYSATSPAGSTTWNTSTLVTATAGEYEGRWVPAGSTIRLVSSGVSVMGNVQVNVMGYIRYVNSTRSV